MALHPSGSREEVTLVQIETSDFSLVIKGKPYHQRYEGLQQYRKMDFHDTMQFSVHGVDIVSVSVFDIEQGNLVKNVNIKPIFFENGIYQVIVIPKRNTNLTFNHEHPLLRQAISRVDLPDNYMLMGALQFQNEVGLTSFEIHSEQQKLLEVTLEIFPTKLDYKNDYKKLLEEVNEEIYNLAYHFIRKTYLGASIKLDSNSHPSKAEFYRLISKHFVHFIQATDRIEQQPHHNLQKTYQRARGDQLSQLDSRSRKFLQKTPHLFVEVQKGIDIGNRRVMPLVGLDIKKELTYDTLENRYVKWMIERLIHKLNDLKNTLLLRQNRWDADVDQHLIETLSRMENQLKGKLKRHFWRNIRKLDRSVMSLVLQMAPGYRDAFKIFLTVSKGLTLQGKFYQMSVIDVATLYEYWTFLKIGRILDKKYELISKDIIKINREGLFVNLQTNQSANRIYRHPITDEKIVLTYQYYKGDLPTIPQKPDTMLSISKKGKDYSFNYVFDAKYRIDYALEGSYYHSRYRSPGPIEEDINTMHRYRDSIVASFDGPYERTAFGAYILFPWFEEDIYREHHFYKSIDKVNIGGLPFLPNTTTLVEQFIERLIDMSPEEIQKEGILPRGTVAEWKSGLEEKVIIGLVSTNVDYTRFEQERVFEMPATNLKKGWQEGKYIALYAKEGVSDKNGVSMYGQIESVSYISNGEKIKFDVNHWIPLGNLIRPVNYGVAGMALTTLSALTEAKELPELFMKSSNEVVLWRMLRRVSDKIHLQLDNSLLDNAKKIEEYTIKDITIKINQSTEKITFSKYGKEESIELGYLKKQPSMVFKRLLRILD
ncbi:restriction endonuclease-like protein [Lederbergia galactosidilytica]|uniref:5-methylcytosine-specific restriction related enzyme n=1 Tax=Lederbergia galactosidilytica TaxID=217031 RepID=A0A178A7N7_9BACI|nr:restriction endonuclease-like protein [Lederbergia galactosidilytica]OAK75480.1 5-methylcytosine-specific restriction related enzyme [Lederbergia galactosidilytica]